MQSSNLLNNFWFFLLSFGLMQGIFLSISLFRSKKGNKSANKFLAILMIIFSFLLTEPIIRVAGLYPNFPHMIRLTAPFWYLLPVLFYFYISFLINKIEKRLWVIFLHLLPFLVLLIDAIPFYFASADIKLSGSGKDLFLFSYDGKRILSGQIQTFLYFLSMISYLVISFIRIKKYKKQFKQVSSQVSGEYYLDWVKRIFLFFTFYVILELTVVTYLSFTSSISQHLISATICIVSFFTHFVAYSAMLQPNIVFPIISEDSFKNYKIKKDEHYQDEANSSSVNPLLKNTDSNELVNNLKNKDNNSINENSLENDNSSVVLNDLMEKEQLYRNSDLKLIDLCNHLSLTTHQVSQMLNDHLKTNFYDFVNKFRIEEVKQLLLNKQYQNFTILGIALEAGFNSNASFYRVFKKEVGLTPKMYIKSNQI